MATKLPTDDMRFIFSVKKPSFAADVASSYLSDGKI